MPESLSSSSSSKNRDKNQLEVDYGAAWTLTASPHSKKTLLRRSPRTPRTPKGAFHSTSRSGDVVESTSSPDMGEVDDFERAMMSPSPKSSPASSGMKGGGRERGKYAAQGEIKLGGGSYSTEESREE